LAISKYVEPYVENQFTRWLGRFNLSLPDECQNYAKVISTLMVVCSNWYDDGRG